MNERVIGTVGLVLTLGWLAVAQPILSQDSGGRRANLELVPGVWGRVAVPDGVPPFPAVVLLHGGSGERPEQAQFALDLTRRGFATLMLEYYGPTADGPPNEDSPVHWRPWQEMIRQAVQYVGALEFVDPNRIALLGWSRGAILSLHTAPSIPELGAVVSLYGAVCGGWVPPSCGADSEVQRRNREEPLRLLPPTLLLHGEADPVIDVSESRRVHELLTSSGRLVDLITYPGADHGFDFPRSDPEYYDEAATTDAYRRIVEFLETHLLE